jgi:hypothetical protein
MSFQLWQLPGSRRIRAVASCSYQLNGEDGVTIRVCTVKKILIKGIPNQPQSQSWSSWFSVTHYHMKAILTLLATNLTSRFSCRVCCQRLCSTTRASAARSQSKLRYFVEHQHCRYPSRFFSSSLSCSPVLQFTIWSPANRENLIHGANQLYHNQQYLEDKHLNSIILWVEYMSNQQFTPLFSVW